MRHHREVAVVVALGTVAWIGSGCDGSSPSTQTVTDTASTATVSADTAPTDTAPVASTSAGTATSVAATEPDEQMFPDVIGATATAIGETWTIAATLSSPYDSPERYADAWRVLGPDGTVYGERILAHDHASEQPFTRSEAGIVIPDDVDVVTIQGRDQRFGYGGDTFELTLPR